MDETTHREDSAGQVTRAACCGNQAGKAGDWLHYRELFALQVALCKGEFNISLRI